MGRQKVFWWISTVIIALAIFAFSSQQGTDSSSISEWLLKLLSGDKIASFLGIDMASIHTFLRKLTHFTIYAFFGMSVYNLLRSYRIRGGIWVGVLICLLYAISDEFHQSFIPGRSAEVMDVAIDTAGSFVGMHIVRFVFGKR